MLYEPVYAPTLEHGSENSHHLYLTSVNPVALHSHAERGNEEKSPHYQQIPLIISHHHRCYFKKIKKNGIKHALHSLS